MKVKKGDSVTVDYEGRFESGEIFDTSTHGDHSHPLTFTAGEGEVVQGFDDAVMGMEVGEEKEVTLQANQAYGDYNDKLTQKIPRDKLPQGQEPQKGMMLMLQSPQGHQMPARIADVSATDITIDLNHPLAGKTLIFKIKLNTINA